MCVDRCLCLMTMAAAAGVTVPLVGKAPGVSQNLKSVWASRVHPIPFISIYSTRLGVERQEVNEPINHRKSTEIRVFPPTKTLTYTRARARAYTHAPSDLLPLQNFLPGALIHVVVDGNHHIHVLLSRILGLALARQGIPVTESRSHPHVLDKTHEEILVRARRRANRCVVAMSSFQL